MVRKYSRSDSDTESSNGDETTKLLMDAHVGEPSRTSDIGINPGKKRRLVQPVGGYGVRYILIYAKIKKKINFKIIRQRIALADRVKCRIQ